MFVSSRLIEFIFETDNLRLDKLDPKLTIGEYEEIIGSLRYKRLSDLYYKLPVNYKDINILEVEIKDLIYLYYTGKINNKSLKDIENDLIIKDLLE